LTEDQTSKKGKAPSEKASGSEDKGSPKIRKKSVFREYAEAIFVALAVALFLRFFVVEAFKIPSGSMVETLAIGDFIFVNKLSYRTEIPYSFLGVEVPGGGKTLIDWGEPSRGEIVVFRNPREPETDFIKRVVALPGDEVKVRGSVLFVKPAGDVEWIEHKREFTGQTGYASRPSPSGCVEQRAHRYIEDNGDRSYPVLGLLEEKIDRSTGGSAEPVELVPVAVAGQHYGPVTVQPGHFFAMGDNRDNSTDSRFPSKLGQVPMKNIKGRALFVWLSLDRCESGFSKVRWDRFFHGIK